MADADFPKFTLPGTGFVSLHNKDTDRNQEFFLYIACACCQVSRCKTFSMFSPVFCHFYFLLQKIMAIINQILKLFSFVLATRNLA